MAIVHGLNRGGAARRLQGTVDVLQTVSGVELREFAVGDAVPVAARRDVRVWSPGATRRPRLVRPVSRYSDALAVRRAWLDLWRRVNDWAPDSTFVNPCATPSGAPPGLSHLEGPSLYYCDEPRRVDYERRARLQSNPLTRVPYFPMRRFERRGERASVAAATRLLTNSHFTAGRIRSAYGRGAAVVSPGIDEMFSPGEPGERSSVLTIGTLIPTKGHDLVLRAVGQAGVGRPVCVVAPRPDKIEQQRLHRIAGEVGVELEIRTGISDADLVDLYRSAWVTMYLAREEPLGLVSWESQACGTPVIVADEGGLVETVAPGVSGLRVARDVEAAAEAVRSLEVGGFRAELARGASDQQVPRVRETSPQILAHLLELAG